MIQSILRMRSIQKNYKSNMIISKTTKANFIQRYLRGFKIHKYYKEIIHREKIDKLMSHFRLLKLEMQTDAQIKIRYHWFKYKKKRDIKLAKQAALASKKKKNFKKPQKQVKLEKRPGGSGTFSEQKKIAQAVGESIQNKLTVQMEKTGIKVNSAVVASPPNEKVDLKSST